MPVQWINNPLVMACRAHLKRYYSRYLYVYGLDEEDVVQAVVVKLLDGSCCNVNSACKSIVRAGIRYRKREILK